jgi:hypothetical protein
MSNYLDPVINAYEKRLTGGNGPPPTAEEIIDVGGGLTVPTGGRDRRGALRAGWAATALRRIGHADALTMERRAAALSGSHQVNGTPVAALEALEEGN